MSTAFASGDVPIDGQGLDGERLRLILDRRAATAAERTAPREGGVAVLVCMIGGERFAVPLTLVAEVLTTTTTPVRVPDAPDSLTGLIVRRGLVYNLIDPSSALGVGRRESLHTLVLRGAVPRIALRVDEALEAADITAAGEDGGLTDTRIGADGARVELIALPRLFAALGLLGRTEPT